MRAARLPIVMAHRKLSVDPSSLEPSGFGLGNAVPDVISNKPPQMGLTQHDHLIQQLSATASYPTLRHAVLPGDGGRPFESVRCRDIPASL